MTVAELIEALEKIEDKTLDVVADTGLGEELVCDVFETKAYYGKCENDGWCGRKRNCVKIVG